MANFASDELLKAYKVVKSSPYYNRTPMIPFNRVKFDFSLNLKLENMQNTGSFKIRGVINQIEHFQNKDQGIVTSSAGNYGKALAYISRQLNLKSTIFMPDIAPNDRVKLIRSLGSKVQVVSNSILQSSVDQFALDNNATFLHPYDDYNLICGHASCGFEIIEDNPTTDVVVVCCGGGGLLAGVALAIHAKNPNCLIYGVEPRGAAKMFASFKSGKPEALKHVGTIASGLAPPYAGQLTFEVCSRLVDACVLVSDEEIEAAVALCYASGLVVEASGAAALAAILFHKLPLDGAMPTNREDLAFSRDRPPLTNRKVISNVTVIITGGNVTPDALAKMVDKFEIDGSHIRPNPHNSLLNF